MGVQAIADIIRQLTPEFDKHVEAYIEAVAKLPEDITAETLVFAGADRKYDRRQLGRTRLALRVDAAPWS
jgi:hypothetical protein